MKNILFASDLDNTLIYSGRHKLDDDICIEYIHEKPQGYISKKTLDALKNITSGATVLPITTRSIEQYLRIQWPEGCEPEYAITTNGAVLLHRGKPVEEWWQSTQELIKPFEDELERMHTLLAQSDKFIRCRIVDSSYLFVYCKDGVSAGDCMQEYSNETTLCTVASGKKLYFFPNMINKGESLKRFLSFMPYKTVICAGDSSIDIPLLVQGDIAYVPGRTLAGQCPSDKVSICPEGVRFSEFVTHSTLSFVTQNCK